MSTIDESGAGMADSDINSTNPEGRSTAEAASGDDVARGNLDGSTPVEEPRDRSLDEAGGNGSFEDVSDSAAADGTDGSLSDVADSGQDNGLNE